MNEDHKGRGNGGHGKKYPRDAAGTEVSIFAQLTVKAKDAEAHEA